MKTGVFLLGMNSKYSALNLVLNPLFSQFTASLPVNLVLATESIHSRNRLLEMRDQVSLSLQMALYQRKHQANMSALDGSALPSLQQSKCNKGRGPTQANGCFCERMSHVATTGGVGRIGLRATPGSVHRTCASPWLGFLHASPHTLEEERASTEQLTALSFPPNISAGRRSFVPFSFLHHAFFQYVEGHLCASKRPRHHQRELFSPERAAVRSGPLFHDHVRTCIA